MVTGYYRPDAVRRGWFVMVIAMLSIFLISSVEGVWFFPSPKPTSNAPTKTPTAAPTKQPTNTPTLLPTLSPTTSKPTKSPTTSRPTLSPSHAPSRSPTRSPTQLAVTYTNTISVTRIIFDEETATTLDVTNILTSDIQASFVPCDSGSGEWIGADDVGIARTIPAGATSLFTLKLRVTSGYDPLRMEPSKPLTGCVRLSVTTSIDPRPQIYEIPVLTSVAFRCEPGTASPTGDNHPIGCSICRIGTYSEVQTATECTECPESLPRTLSSGSDSSSACEACPLGSYCEIGFAPQLCPMGAYESLDAQVKDRFITDCVRLSCTERYWCGAGAVENLTHVQMIDYENSLRNLKILIKQRKVFTLALSNLASQTMGVELSTYYPTPYYVRSSSVLSIPGNSDMDFTIQFDSTDIPTEKLDSFFYLDWFLVDKPSERFQTRVNVSMQVVTLVVSPAQFTYYFTVGENNTVSPIPQIEFVNTLCNNTVTLSVAPTCNGVPLATWITFPELTNPTPFEPRLIEEQRGLPEKYDFSINFSDPIFGLAHPSGSTNGSRNRAPNYTSCLDVSLVMNGLDSTLERAIPIIIHVLRPCPPGMFSPKGDDSDGCSPCAEGYYQPGYGKQFCEKCPDSFPRTLLTGSIQVEQCIPDRGGFVDSNGTLEKCPRGAVCDEVGMTVESLRLEAGFWRASAVSTKVLECPRQRYCLGGKLSNKLSTGRKLDEGDGLPSPDGVCRQNHTGPFCYGCLPGYYKRTNDKVCMLCNDVDYDSDRDRVVAFFTGMGILFSCFLCIFFWTTCRQHKFRRDGTTSRIEARIQRIYDALDISIPIQIVIGFLQVVGGMSTTFSEILPPFFAQIRDTFSVLALDLVQVFDFGCTLYAQNHFTSLLVTSLIPIGVTLLLLFVHVVLEKTYGKFDAILRQELRTTTFSAFLVLLFLVYPSCSVRILATFACRSFDDGRRALITDPSVDCDSEQYGSYYYYAIFMTFVYPIGIPILYTALLYRERKALNPYSKDHRLEKVAEAIREKNRDVRYLRFLWKPYKTHYFWFETVELLRKLCQTSIVVFVASGSSGQMIFQLLVTTVSIVVLNAMLPYIDIGNNLLALLAQWAIFGIAIITLLTKLNRIGIASGLNEYNQSTLDSFLMLMFFIVPSFAAVQVLIQIFGRGALREIFVCLNWEKIDKKVEKLKVISISRRNLQQEKHPEKDSFADISKDPPKTLPEAMDLARRIRDNLSVVRRDLTDKYEQERARAEVLEDERAKFENRTADLEAELEKARLLLAEQENIAARQHMLAQDAFDKAHAEANGRRTMILGRRSDLSEGVAKRTSDLEGNGRKSNLGMLDPRKSELGKAIRRFSFLPTHLLSGSHQVNSENAKVGESPAKDSASSFFSNSLFGRNRKAAAQVSNLSSARAMMPAISEQGESIRSIVFVREKELRDGSYEKHEEPIVSGDPNNNRKSMRSVVKERENLDGSFQVDVMDE